MSNYTAKVVGMHFREREGVPAKAIVGNMLEGAKLVLVREPDNAYDVYAIKVLSGNQHIGYIEADAACYIAPDMDDGMQFQCEVTSFVDARNNLYPIVNITSTYDEDE